MGYSMQQFALDECYRKYNTLSMIPKSAELYNDYETNVSKVVKKAQDKTMIKLEQNITKTESKLANWPESKRLQYKWKYKKQIMDTFKVVIELTYSYAEICKLAKVLDNPYLLESEISKLEKQLEQLSIKHEAIQATLEEMENELDDTETKLRMIQKDYDDSSKKYWTAVWKGKVRSWVH